MNKNNVYTSTLSAGLGLIDETLTLLDIWRSGMSVTELYQRSLESGYFPTISARRLKNIINMGFAPRYLRNDALPAKIVKSLQNHIPMSALQQLMFLYTARANTILYDFVRCVFWEIYASGQDSLTNETARKFVDAAVREGKTTTVWSDTGKKNVAGYLTGCCADYGLLEKGRKTSRRFVPFRLVPQTTVVLAYDLHFSGLGDNSVIAHPDWELFGLQKEEVRDELKRLALKGFFIIQTAGAVTRISWNFKKWEDVIHVIIES